MTKRLLNFSSNVIHHRRFDRFPFFSRLPSENGSFLLDRGRDRNCSAVTTALLAKALRVSMQSAIPAGLLAARPPSCLRTHPSSASCGYCAGPSHQNTHTIGNPLPLACLIISFESLCQLLSSVVEYMIPLCTRCTHFTYLGE